MSMIKDKIHKRQWIQKTKYAQEPLPGSFVLVNQYKIWKNCNKPNARNGSKFWMYMWENLLREQSFLQISKLSTCKGLKNITVKAIAFYMIPLVITGYLQSLHLGKMISFEQWVISLRSLRVCELRLLLNRKALISWQSS